MPYTTILTKDVSNKHISAQVQRQKPTSNDEKSFKEPKDPKGIPSTSAHRHNGLGRKHQREGESTKTKKRHRHEKIPPRRRTELY